MRKFVYYVLALLLFVLVILPILTGVFYYYIFEILFILLVLLLLNWIFICKPTDQEWASIENAWHYTSLKNREHIDNLDGLVELKTSRNPLVNLFVFCKPAVYFFYIRPSELNKKTNLPFTDTSIEITIKAKNLEKNLSG